MLRSLLALSPLLAAAQAPEVLWTYDLSNLAGEFVSVGPDGTIYTVDQAQLHAIDPSGAVKWTFLPAGGAGGLSLFGGGQPMDFLADGRVVVGSGRTIWALRPDGQMAWSYTWPGGFKNQLDNGPGVGPDGNVYATTAVNDGLGLGAFSLSPAGELRWNRDASPSLVMASTAYVQRLAFTNDRAVFGFVPNGAGPPPLMHAFDFAGQQTDLIDTCTSVPRTDGSARLLFGGPCGIRAYDLASQTVEWTVDLSSDHPAPIADAAGVVYSGQWLGGAVAIDTNGQVLWTSAPVGLQAVLAVSEPHGLLLYRGGTVNQPNWVGALDTATGAEAWRLDLDSQGGEFELQWSSEAGLSADGSVAYFTTRFAGNTFPGRLWAVHLGEPSAAVGYCTAGTSAAGCRATLEASGSPSATATSGFTVTATNVEGAKDGLLYFGTSGRQAAPWGSGSSFQCVAPPVARGGLLIGSGTAGSCDGAFAQDLNGLWCATCPKPAKNPGAGAVVQAQLWYRDPLNTSNQTTSLSDALEFTVAP